MRTVLLYPLWFALLMGAPLFQSSLTGNLPDRVAGVSSFWAQYWVVALVGVAVLLVPPRAWVRAEKRAGWTRVRRAVCVGFWLCAACCVVSVARLALSVLTNLFQYNVYVVLNYLALLLVCASMLVFAGTVRSHVHVKGERGSLCALAPLLCSGVLTGCFRMVWAAPFEPSLYGDAAHVDGILVASIAVVSYIPCVALCGLGAFVSARSGGRGFAAWAAGSLYGELVGHVLLRLVPALYIGVLEYRTAIGLACAGATLASCLLASRLSSGSVRAAAPAPEPPEQPVFAIDASWGLTAREREAVEYALGGTPSRSAAEAMGISASTVRNLQSHAWAKMGVSSVAAARELARRPAPAGGRIEPKVANLKRVWGVAAILCLAVLAGLLPWNAGDASWYTPVNTCAAAAVGLLGPLLAYSCGFFGDAGCDDIGKSAWIVRCGLLLVCALLELATQVAAVSWLPAVALVSSWTVAEALCVLDAAGDAERPSASSLLSTAVLAGMVSLTCYVFWRDAVWPFAAPVEQFRLLSIFILVFPVLGFALVRRVGTAAGIAALATAGLACALISSWHAVLATALTVAIAVTLAHMRESGGSRGALPCAVLGVSVGLMVGAGCFARADDAMHFMLAFDQVAAERDARLMFSFGLGGGVAVAVLASAALWAELIGTWRRITLAGAFEPLPEERAQSALRAKGLSDLEVNVLTGTLRGQTLKQVAASVHYSASTVYLVRRDAYRKLGVHDAQGVLDIIQQVTGL